MTRTVIAMLSSVLFGSVATASFAEPPAALAPSDPSRARALGSLERFAESWMDSLERLEAQGRAAGARQGGYRGFGPDYAVTLKATGNSRAPWVGLIRYTEHEYACQQAGCSRASSRKITEIFRFQEGRWVY